MKIIKNITLLLILSTYFISNAQSSDLQKLEIESAWARPSMGKPNSAAYMKIRNTTPNAIEIVSSVSDVANSTELHQSIEDRGIMRMHAVDKLVVPAYETIELKPKGAHVMLMKLKKNLNEGDVVKIILTTSKDEAFEVKAPIKKSQ